MSKDRLLFSIVGALAGFVVGFMFANSVNRAGPADAHAGHDHGPRRQQMGGLPPDHPPIDMAAMKADPAALAEAAERADRSPDDFDAQAAAPATVEIETGRRNDLFARPARITVTFRAAIAITPGLPPGVTRRDET
jgi:cytochrome c556